jgi:predicted Zn-dependent peptidase
VRVVSERLDGVRSIALGIWIHSGSRSEPDAKAGISHFIEHLLFKGTEHYSAYDIARIFDEMGGEPNAATSKEHTFVHARFLDEHLDRAFEVLAEMVTQPSFANLDAEREVVLEEVAMYEDSPPELIHDHLTEAVFGEHPLGRPIIGYSGTLRRQDRRTVAAYHHRHYTNPAMVVAAGGNVDHDRLCALTAAHFPAGGGSRSPQPVAVSHDPRHVALFTRKDTEQYHVCLGGPAPPRDDPRRYALWVVDTILGGSWSSRLFQEVRDERGLAYSVYSYTSLYSDVGMAAVYFGSREEGVGEALRLILQELGSIVRHVPDDEIARAKNHLKGQLVLSMESPQSRMQALGRSILFGMPVLSVDELLAEIDAVTAAGVAEVAAEFYDVSRWSAACIGPAPDLYRAALEGFAWGER